MKYFWKVVDLKYSGRALISFLAVVYVVIVGFGIAEIPAKRAASHERNRVSSEVACADHGGWRRYKTQKIGFNSYELRAYCHDGYWTAIP